MNHSLDNVQIAQITAIRYRIPQIRFDLEKNKFVTRKKNYSDNSVTIDFEEDNVTNDDEKSTENQPKLLQNIYPYTQILSKEKVAQLKMKSDFDNFDYFTSCTWMQVVVPYGCFDYTTAILTNRPFEGLMFVMINNWESLAKWIPSVGNWLRGLDYFPILKQFDKMRYLKKEERDSRVAINGLCDAIERLDNSLFYDVHFALYRIQIEILLFFRRIVIQGKYLGREIPFRNFNKLYFQLHEQYYENFEDEEKQEVLCLGVSKETYSEVAEFSNYQNLPVRIIKFAYVTDMREYRINEHKLGFDERVRLLNKQKAQTPDSRTLLEAFSSSVIVSKTAALELKQLMLSMNYWWLVHDSRLFALYTSSLLLHIQMPKQFGYTCAVESKNIRAGLLHSIARHSDQWVQHIDGFGLVMDKLGLVRQQLDRIRTVEDVDDRGKRTAYRQYLEEYNKIQENDEFQLSLLEAQIGVLQRIQQIVNNQTYAGEQINDEGKISALFKVDNLKGESYLMYLAVSDNLYPPIQEFADPRPVRTVVTVYFGSWELYSKLDVITGMVWKDPVNQDNTEMTKLSSALEKL